MKKLLIGIVIAVVCIRGLSTLDRYFFKQNNSFCLRYIYSTLHYNPDWELPAISPQESLDLQKILQQKFHYLGKGCQAYAFISEDGKYVLKFCKIPSALRPFSKWKFSKETKTKRALTKLHNSFHSYKLAYQELKEQSGLLYIHLNPSKELKTTATIIDKLGAHYHIPLDHVVFILQKKAELIYPSLENYKKQKANASVQCALASLIDLFINTSSKGIINNDVTLHKNYGFIEDRAIYIDIGNFEHLEEMKEPKRAKEHLLAKTAALKRHLQDSYPEFLPFYEEALTKN